VSDAGCSDQRQGAADRIDIHRAEAGEEIVLTRHGRAVVRLVPVEAAVAPAARKKLLEAVRASGAARARPGESAARSQNFLFEPDRLPR
jgi:antitoxin (DNA-binding transcriptional repressor) of toxin-antitoxin stability system